MAELTRIILHGKAFVFVGDDRSYGAIATEEQYRNGLRSYGHLFPDGRIMRLHEQIGTREDIQWGEQITIEPTMEAMVSLCCGLGWTGVDDTVDIV